ncbi:MAG: Gfo/Idh/MocA family oxidoreductase [Planctomycetota bacterium]
MPGVRVAFVGAGGNASGHMKRVKELCGETEIVAICDIDAERAKKASEEFGGAPYTDHHEMLDNVGMDALYVSVPPFAHTDAEIIAAKKGIHLFIEKPVALTMKKGLEVNKAIQKAGVISCVGYQVRYAESVNRAKKWLDGKTVAMVNCHRWGGVPGTAWWCVMSKSGGQIVEQTTHQVDLLRYLCGEIEEVHANYALRHSYENKGFDIPDVMAVTLKFANGAVGVLTSSCAMTKGGGKGDLEIMADHCVLKWGATSVSAAPGEHPDLAGELPPLPPIDPMFIEAVRTGDGSKIRSPYLDGLKSLDVTLAMNKSAETGKPTRTYFADK